MDVLDKCYMYNLEVFIEKTTWKYVTYTKNVHELICLSCHTIEVMCFRSYHVYMLISLVESGNVRLQKWSWLVKK